MATALLEARDGAPDIPPPDAVRDRAERRVRAGVRADPSEVVRAGPRETTDEDGAPVFSSKA